MKCPICGGAELVREARDLPYEYNGQRTTIPAVTGDYCEIMKMNDVKTPPAHPGELLGYELFSRGLNKAQAARLLGVDVGMIGRIVRGVNGIPVTIAYRLELAGAGKAAEWLKLQAEYDLYRASMLNFADVKPFPPHFGRNDSAHLLADPANRAHIEASLAAFDRGDFDTTEHFNV